MLAGRRMSQALDISINLEEPSAMNTANSQLDRQAIEELVQILL